MLLFIVLRRGGVALIVVEGVGHDGDDVYGTKKIK